ncbi:MAG: cyclic nucleotide-binding domain-containing protein [Bacteroidota bacterium]
MFKLFNKTYSEKELSLFRFLSKNRLFDTLTNEELAEFVPVLHKRQYKENEVVFFSNDPSNALYIIKNGIVTLNLDVKGEFERLVVLRSGKVFGDNAIIGQTKRIYTAIVTSEKAEIYVIPRINLEEIMGNDMQIKAKLMAAVAREYDEYMQNLFKGYKDAYGFFNINMIYHKS